MKHLRKRIVILLAFACCLLSGSCGRNKAAVRPGERVLFTSAGGKINTLDPALAADLVSQYMVACFYDTLVQYNYKERPYKLEPGLLAKMPVINSTMTRYEFELKEGLQFQDDPCFAGKGPESRHITSKDVVFSILRIADARLYSPGFWLFRKKIKGIDQFRAESAKLKKGDFSIYDKGCEGIQIIDERRFAIELNKPEPRLLYALAMPYAGVVSRTAVTHYGDRFAEKPVSSGPFKLVEWWRNYRIILVRNKAFRKEYFTQAVNPADRIRPLPLVDKIVCYLVKQPLPCWLLFLQGELDMTALNKDNFEAVVSQNLELVPALKKRHINMFQIPGFAVNYLGFCFTDPLLAKNKKLRQAVSHAYDIEKRRKLFNYRVIKASGPIPPGVPGHDPELQAANTYDLEKAAKLLAEAGYPNGINQATGERLVLTFDQAGSTSTHSQLAELMTQDMKKIGIEVKSILNNKTRFFQKLRKGNMQLFRLSWIGDYPDAENFLQLFYGPNAGSCNRAFYQDKAFDQRFEEIMNMPDSPERTEKYKKMSRYIVEQAPWVFESYPIDYRLTHDWLQNYVPHDFAFAGWKYLAVEPEKRHAMRKTFKPLSMTELRENLKQK